MSTASSSVRVPPVSPLPSSSSFSSSLTLPSWSRFLSLSDIGTGPAALDWTFIQPRLDHLLSLLLLGYDIIDISSVSLVSLVPLHRELLLPTRCDVLDLFNFFLLCGASQNLYATLSWLESAIQSSIHTSPLSDLPLVQRVDSVVKLYGKLTTRFPLYQIRPGPKRKPESKNNNNQSGPSPRSVSAAPESSAESSASDAEWANYFLSMKSRDKSGPKSTPNPAPASASSSAPASGSGSSSTPMILSFSSYPSITILTLLLLRSFSIAIHFTPKESESIPRLQLNLRQMMSNCESKVREIMDLVKSKEVKSGVNEATASVCPYSDHTVTVLGSLSGSLKVTHLLLVFQSFQVPLSDAVLSQLLRPLMDTQSHEQIIELIIMGKLQPRFHYRLDRLEYRPPSGVAALFPHVNALSFFSPSLQAFRRLVIDYFLPYPQLHSFLVKLLMQQRQASAAFRALSSVGYSLNDLRRQYPMLVREVVWPAIRFAAMSGNGFEILENIGEDFPEFRDAIIDNLRRANDPLSLVKFIRMFQLDRPENSSFASSNRRILQAEGPYYEERLKKKLESERAELATALNLPENVKVIFLQSPQSIAEGRDALAKEQAKGPIESLGFDSESSFSPLQNKLALLQIAARDVVFLVDAVNYTSEVDQFITQLFQSVPLKLGFNLVSDFNSLNSSDWVTPLCPQRQAFLPKTIGKILDIEQLMFTRARAVHEVEEKKWAAANKKAKEDGANDNENADENDGLNNNEGNRKSKDKKKLKRGKSGNGNSNTGGNGNGSGDKAAADGDTVMGTAENEAMSTGEDGTNEPPRPKQPQTKGLTDVCARYLGAPLSKSQRMSNWARRPLTEMQMHYAALDAWCLKPLLDAITKEWETDRASGELQLPPIDTCIQKLK